MVFNKNYPTDCNVNDPLIQSKHKRVAAIHLIVCSQSSSGRAAAIINHALRRVPLTICQSVQHLISVHVDSNTSWTAMLQESEQSMRLRCHALALSRGHALRLDQFKDKGELIRWFRKLEVPITIAQNMLTPNRRKAWHPGLTLK
jgi:hypothetical protein